MIFDVLLLVFFVIILAYLISQRRPSDFPPGPFGLPILGHLLQLGEAPFLKLQNEWKDKYGPIVGVYFGSYRTVAISGHTHVRDALLEPALAGRPDMPIWRYRSRDVRARGIIFTEGSENTENRRLALRSLKQFGYGQKSFENVITSEILSMIGKIDENPGAPVELKNRFHVHMLNILWVIVSGQDCEEDRATLSTMFANCTKLMEENNGLKSLFMFLPWMAKYFPSLSGFNNVNSELGAVWEFLGKHIQQHKTESVENPGSFNDYIGYFINEINKTKDPDSCLYKDVGERSLMTSLIDFFFAGTDTTANTLHWACLILICNPKVQEKLQVEIDRIVGTGRLPEANDEPDMPYMQAFIQEVLRFTSIAPLAVFHSAIQDVHFHGYKIPKDTMVLLNLHGVHHSKEYWTNPEDFSPERFFEADGKTLKKHDAFFPFGLGKRVCVGETLARNEMFIFMASLLQRYRVEKVPGTEDPSLKPIVTFLLVPPNAQVIFNSRQKESFKPLQE